MKQRTFSTIILIICLSCNAAKEQNLTRYLEHVGDTEYNKSVDDPNFKLCEKQEPIQYYFFPENIKFDSERKYIINFFNENYNPSKVKKESGYITIRFIVNCYGETGWFRVQQMDNSYNAITFDRKITDQLLNLSKQLNAEEFGLYVHKEYDYYRYLTFKIQNGDIEEVLP